MGAVCGSEGVVDVDVGIAGELFGEFFVVFAFAFVKTEVFEQQDLVVAEFGDEFLGGVSDGIIGELDLVVEEFGEFCGDGFEALGGVHAFGSSKVRGEDQAGISGESVVDGGKNSAKSRVVFDFSVFDRGIEIKAHEDPFAGQIDLIDRGDLAPVHRHEFPFSFYF